MAVSSTRARSLVLAALVFDMLSVVATIHDRRAVAAHRVESYTQVPALTLQIAAVLSVVAAFSTWHRQRRRALVVLGAVVVAAVLTKLLWDPRIGDTNTKTTPPQPPPPTVAAIKPASPPLRAPLRPPTS